MKLYTFFICWNLMYSPLVDFADQACWQTSSCGKITMGSNNFQVESWEASRRSQQSTGRDIIFPVTCSRLVEEWSWHFCWRLWWFPLPSQWEQWNGTRAPYFTTSCLQVNNFEKIDLINGNLFLRGQDNVMDIQKLEAAQDAYIAAVTSAKQNQDDQSIATAASARFYLQSLILSQS